MNRKLVLAVAEADKEIELQKKIIDPLPVPHKLTSGAKAFIESKPNVKAYFEGKRNNQNPLNNCTPLSTSTTVNNSSKSKSNKISPKESLLKQRISESKNTTKKATNVQECSSTADDKNKVSFKRKVLFADINEKLLEKKWEVLLFFLLFSPIFYQYISSFFIYLAFESRYFRDLPSILPSKVRLLPPG
jgi:hypothetical protein